MTYSFRNNFQTDLDETNTNKQAENLKGSLDSVSCWAFFFIQQRLQHNSFGWRAFIMCFIKCRQTNRQTDTHTHSSNGSQQYQWKLTMAMRLVKGVWEKNVTTGKLNHRLLTSRVSVLTITPVGQPCPPSLILHRWHWSASVTTPGSHSTCAIRTPFRVNRKHLSFRGEAM